MSDFLSRDGDPVIGVNCPNCGEFTVVYSGTYFCTDPECGWGMSENESPSDRDIVRRYLMQRWHKARRAGNQDEVDRMAHYLVDYLPSV